ncbi:MAG: CHAT domain-containing protein [Bacteroidales bacterium]|nr:CHAT domain-containing protein [Bacteroidales bacterium]
MKKILSLAILVLLHATTFSQANTNAIFHKSDSLNDLGDTFFDANKYKKAIELYNQAAEMTREINNGCNTRYVASLESIGLAYSYMGDNKNALKYFLQKLEFDEKLSGKESEDYAYSLYWIGYCYAKIGDYRNALKYDLQNLEIEEKVYGKESEDYAASLKDIAAVYSYMKDYHTALKYDLQALEIRGNVLGKNNPDYASSLVAIGRDYGYIGDYQNSLEYYLQAKKIREKILGKAHPDYATTLNEIGSVYTRIGDYREALDCFLQVMKIRERDLGNNHPDYAALLSNIGYAYSKIGDYDNALEYHRQALKIRESALGKEHSDYATSLNNIGYAYSKTGDNKNALRYYSQALEIREKVLGKEHPDYATSLNNIGNVYSYIGDTHNALKYHLQALEIYKKAYGEESPQYAMSLNNIGSAYSKMGDSRNALKYYLQSLEIQEKTLGKENANYAGSLNNIGLEYTTVGDYQKALECHKQALEIQEKILGKEHLDYAASLSNIGKVYFFMNDPKNAQKYTLQALEIQGKVIGKENLCYASSLTVLAPTYFATGNRTEAMKTNKQATDICRRNLIRNFSFMTANEREAFWNTYNGFFSKNIMFLHSLPNDTVVTKTCYDSELITKGLLLASEVSMTNVIMESGDSALVAEYEKMKLMRQKINREYEKPIAERVYDCDSLENEIQKMERNIMENCKEFGDVTHFIKIDWKEVQKSLKSNDVAIEFSNFTWEDTTIYVALILTKGMEAPVCIPLFNDKELRKMIRGVVPAKTGEPDNEENRGATSVAAKKLGIYESTELYRVLWNKLEKYFPENPRIYFAPSGMLHQIAIEYAPIADGKLISDKYEIYRVSSTRYLAMDYMPKPMKNSVLYGGIYYDSDTTTMKQQSNRYSTRSANMNSFADLNKNEERGILSYLPGTKTEVENIVGKLNKKKVKTTLFEGSAANEESFKALSGNDINVLHIATHGFFLPTDEKLSGDQSLIQSGLLLSGANYAWQNLPIPEGVEDGVLTAKEISFLDLRKTDLVVLSACQTALGEITGEGVFGLQRGFKKAGVHTIIMSLWPVDDNATLLMMTEFYTNLTNGMTKREAFLSAQNKVKTTAGFENPRYWAAFIMLDGNER